MTLKIILTGDVNLMNVNDPTVPFRKVSEELKSADLVFSNMECCLYEPQSGVTVDKEHKNEGFFANPKSGGDALKSGGIQAVGIANNVNYGADAITSSIKRLDEIGIPHCGGGSDAVSAKAPIILERKGVKIGIIQKSAVYWATNHEATPATPGIAVMKCHTAYQVPFSKLGPDLPPGNRPGIPPLILTWVDPKYLQAFKDEVAALRKQVDLVIVSCHWGLKDEVLDYMTEWAHAAVDSGADIVMGHGPHFSLAVEQYKGKPIYYGLGSFSFHTGHGGIAHGNWVGELARITVEDKNKIASATFQFVRHNDANETVLCKLADEQPTFEALTKRSKVFKTALKAQGDQVAFSAA